METFKLKERGQVLVTGRSVGEKIATGPVRVIKSVEFLEQFREGDILVTDKTDPDWEPIMKKAAAIVTNRGGRTCHAAIVSRELGVPAIVGTEHGTEVLLKDGQIVTVSCAEGDTGIVYDGKLAFDVQQTNLKDLQRPHTQGHDERRQSRGSLRALLHAERRRRPRAHGVHHHTYIKIHPLALLDFDKLDRPVGQSRDRKAHGGYTDKPQFFVDRLAQGVAMIAAAFYPKDVILRLSDFKSNEYANLIGGRPTSRSRRIR
jgi:pyruvate,water dikinase